jgi:flagellar hook-basal body complex protein FliE
MDPLVAVRAAEARGRLSDSLGSESGRAPKSVAGANFAETLQNAVQGADRLQNEADETVRKFAAGEVDDVHDVLMALDRADLSFRMTLEVRNKLLEAYQEVMRLQA